MKMIVSAQHLVPVHLVMIHFINDQPNCKYHEAHTCNNKHIPQERSLGFYACGDQPPAFALPCYPEDDEQQAARSSDNFMEQVMHFYSLMRMLT